FCNQAPMKQFTKKWPWAAATLLTILFGAMIAPWVDWDKVFETLEKYSRRSKPVVQPKAAVLLASTLDSDTFLVRSTVEPRGYVLHTAGTFATAQNILEREHTEIEVVVVDSRLTGAQKLIQATHSQCPKAHIISLRGPREATRVSALLVAKALR